MSNEEESIIEFEQLIESVLPAEPNGSPMQTMYLAGQQSTGNSHASTTANGIWKLATLVSSSVAAGLMVMLLTQEATESGPLPMSEVAAKDDSEVESSAARVGTRVSQKARVPRTPRGSIGRASFDPMQIAKSVGAERSIDMFEDFEIKRFENGETAREYLP